MQKIVIFFVVLYFIIFGVIAEAENLIIDHDEIIKNKVTIAYDTIKKEGMFGVKSLSMGCYKEFEKQKDPFVLENCALIDMTAGFFYDGLVKTIGGFKNAGMEYFLEKEIEARLNSYLIKLGVKNKSVRNYMIINWWAAMNGSMRSIAKEINSNTEQ
jgi:hypothetical protein